MESVKEGNQFFFVIASLTQIPQQSEYLNKAPEGFKNSSCQSGAKGKENRSRIVNITRNEKKLKLFVVSLS